MSNNLVLIPGLLCTSALYAPQITALSEQYNIIIADHTGHDNMAAIAKDILASAPETFNLGGLSMGGFIAFEIIARAPERVEKLALLNTAARADREDQREQRRIMNRMAEKEGLGPIVDMVAPLCLHPRRLGDKALVSTVQSMMAGSGVDNFVRQQNAIISRRDMRDDLASISCPTLIIAGDADAVTPPKLSREMADLLPNAVLEIIPECGHLSTLERPDAVNLLLAQWLEA